MPLIPNTCTPDLGIRLDREDNIYRPGETVLGWVYRTSHVVSEASIKVSLHGVSRTRMRSGVRWADKYQGQFDIFQGDKNRQSVFQGPLHIGKGDDREELGQEWPFAFKLPTHIDFSWVADKKYGREYFKPIGRAIGREPLPGSFEMSDGDYNEGLVEYYLKATLELQRGGKSESQAAILPVRIVASAPEKAGSDVDNSLQLSKSIMSVEISDLSLTPSEPKPQLSTSQKLMNILRSSSTGTQIQCELQTWAPAVLQIDDPKPLSLLLHAKTTWPRMSQLAEKMAPAVRVNFVEVGIESVVDIKTETTFGSIDDCLKSYKSLTKHIPSSYFSDITIPSAEKLPPIDVGHAVDIRLQSSSLPDTLSHSFSICNIKADHILHWRIECEIEGRSCKTSGSQPIVILPPAVERQAGSDFIAELPSYQCAVATAAPMYEMEG
ncbi:unnamed protein product [Clonostachys solani]|uniref:Arrestin-like N-terminal domain-containing protein n=1 Tax=Clonostachys solani TaxID=160281 RepID=A0A9N9W2U7_9HYPO|nr:unnamed protein product [Clonostachys solani]